MLHYRLDRDELYGEEIRANPPLPLVIFGSWGV
jgi:hypothetical protein